MAKWRSPKKIRDRFLAWQCLIRQTAMREQGGRPSPGMRPRVLDTSGSKVGLLSEGGIPLTEQSNTEAEPITVNLTRPSRGVGAISAYLQRAIETGAYSEGDRLPPERQLAETFQAARSTVRRALDQLEKAGLVSRRLGSGTFVGASSAGSRKASPAVSSTVCQAVGTRISSHTLFTTGLRRNA